MRKHEAGAGQNYLHGYREIPLQKLNIEDALNHADRSSTGNHGADAIQVFQIEGHQLNSLSTKLMNDLFNTVRNIFPGNTA